MFRKIWPWGDGARIDTKKAGAAKRKRWFALAIERLENRLLLANDFWNVDTSGSWDQASNWSTGQVPTVNDNAFIQRNVAVTVTASGSDVANSITTSAGNTLSVTNSLTVSAASQINGSVNLTGNLVANGSITLSGATSWTNGTISGSATVANSGTIMIGGAGDKYLMNGIVLNNSGTIIDDGAGRWRLENSAVLNNLSPPLREHKRRIGGHDFR